MGEAVGTVSALWRFPVKSMGGETLAAAELAETGVVGDRAYALIDRETGRVMSAKTAGSGSEPDRVPSGVRRSTGEGG